MREQHAGPAVYERPERARRTGKPEELTIRRTDTSRRGNAQMPGYAAASRQRKPSGARKNRGKQQRRNGQASYPSSASYAPRGDISTQQTLQLSQQDLFAQHVYSSHAVPSAYTAIGARPTQQAQSARAPQERLRTAWAALLARSRRFGPSLLLFAAALLGGIFAPALFYQTALPRETGAFLLALDFDNERIVLINQLMVVVLGTLLAGVVFRQRIATILGALLYYVVAYLQPFIIQAQHPGPGVGGLKQTLIPGALQSVAISLLALGLIGAAVGALIGTAYGDLALVSVARLVSCCWQAIRQRTIAPLKRIGMPLASVTVGALILLAVLVGSAQAGSLLTNGLSTDLYQTAPQGHTVLTGTVLQLSYTSPALGGIKRTCDVYLPPSYKQNTTERYPVFYLLHGTPGGPGDWFNNAHVASVEDTLLALGKVRETILVGADGHGPTYGYSEWANSLDGRQRMEDAIAFDLVHFIDAHFRTLADPADRAIGGNSEGGFGAPNIALHHPEIFGNVMSLSGYFQALAYAPVFAGRGSALYRAYNSPLAYIYTPSGNKAAHQIHFFIGVGTRDGILYKDGIAFYQALLQLKVHVQLITATGGHNWNTWKLQFAEILPMLEPPPVAPAAP